MRGKRLLIAAAGAAMTLAAAPALALDLQPLPGSLEEQARLSVRGGFEQQAGAYLDEESTRAERASLGQSRLYGQPYDYGYELSVGERAARPMSRAEAVERARPRRAAGDYSCTDCRQELVDGLWVLRSDER